MKCFGPMDHPSLQPVTLKVLPALPTVTVRSHIPGNVATIHAAHKVVRTDTLRFLAVYTPFTHFCGQNTGSSRMVGPERHRTPQ